MTGPATIPTYTYSDNGLNINLIDTPGFENTNKSNDEIFQDISSWHGNLLPLNSTADNFGAHFRCTMSCDWEINPNHGEADLRNDRLRRFCSPDEDGMSWVSSNDQESLFDYSPSERDTTTTAGSSTVQQELTYTNIEHMLAVLKAERGKCLGELRGFDAALETIDQLANRKRPGSEICFHRVCVNDISLP